MKITIEHGLGEICGYNENSSGGNRSMPDILVKIVAITIELGGTVRYTVEHTGNQFGVQRFAADGSALTGDPDYDQELGCYPNKGKEQT